MMSEYDTKLVLAETFKQLVNQIYRDPSKIRGEPKNLHPHVDKILAETSKNLKFNRNYQFEPCQKPVCKVLPNVFNQIPEDLKSWKDLVKNFNPLLTWKQNQSYRGIYPDSFYEKYACVELIGPEAMLLSDEIRAGFLLLDEDLSYPEHNHEALEIYHVLNNGDSLWQKGKGADFVEIQAGNGVFHESFESHAMKTRKQGLLALYTWTGFDEKDNGFARPILDSSK